jgi:hypothetical protein
LRLVYVNSVVLVPSRSSLNVMLNDYTVRQVALDGQNPAQVLEVELPPSRFERGYTVNKLKMEFSMHYNEDACEVPWAANVWTQIDTTASTISIDAEPVPVLQAESQGRLNLDSLYIFMEQAGWYPQRFHLVFPGVGSDLTDDHLSYGSLVAQAVALRQINRVSLDLSFGSGFQDGRDNFVIGTKNELANILDPTELSLINGPYLSIKQNTRDPTRFILIASGNDAGQVRQAITALAMSLVRGGLPAQDFWQVEPRYYDTTLPGEPDSADSALFLNRPMLSEPGAYLLSALGMGEVPFTTKGLNTGNVELAFFLPKNYFPLPETNLRLMLKYNTGAELGPSSVINIYMNQQFANAVPLDRAQGSGTTDFEVEAGFFNRGRTITLPVQLLRPGRNTISIRPRLFPKQYEICEHIQTENLTFTLSHTSELILPPFEGFTRLPDLQLWNHTAYPLTAGTFGDDLSVFVTERNPDAVVAAWMLMAKMVQASGELLHRAVHSFSLQEADRQLLIVGSVDYLGQDILENSPVSMEELKSNQLPLSRSVRVLDRDENWLDAVAGWLGYVRPDEDEEANTPFGLVETDEDSPPLNTSDSGILLEYKSNFGRDASILLATAANPTVLRRGVERLVKENPGGLVQGDLVLWHPEDGQLRVDSYRFGDDYSIGSLAPPRYLFFQQPHFLSVLIVLVIILFAVLTFTQLRRMSKRSSK